MMPESRLLSSFRGSGQRAPAGRSRPPRSGLRTPTSSLRSGRYPLLYNDLQGSVTKAVTEGPFRAAPDTLLEEVNT